MAGINPSWPLSFDPDLAIVTDGTTEPPAQRARTGLHRRGLQIPVGVNRRGSSRTTVGDANDYKIIATALSDNQNEHAWQQDPGLGADFIFGINDEAVRGIIIQRLRDVFAEFERQHRYKFAEDTAVWGQNEGDMTLEFDYFNIESDEHRHFTGTLRGAST